LQKARLQRAKATANNAAGIAGPSGEQSGLGDIAQSLFFSPKKPTVNSNNLALVRRSSSDS
jgi:hypothetical protein